MQSIFYKRHYQNKIKIKPNLLFLISLHKTNSIMIELNLKLYNL